MDISSATEPQVISVELQQDDRHQLLVSAVNTVAAVKRLVANFDQLKEERDNFDLQLASAVAENEALREQVDNAKDNNDQIAKTVAMLTDQMEAIAARCIEAVTILRARLDERAPIQTGLSSTEDGNLTVPVAVQNALGAASKLVDSGSAGEQIAQPTTFEAGSNSINEASRVVHVFTQYLTQSTTGDVHKAMSA